MAKGLLRILVILTLLAAGAAAQEPATAVLRAASAAMGAGAVASIQYSGTGWNAAVGQGYTSNSDWPRADVTAYSRFIDYESRSASEEWTRHQGNHPRQGGGGWPVDEYPTAIDGEWKQRFYVSGDYAWNLDGNSTRPTPGPRLSSSAGGLRPEFRQVEIWMTPHGFIKAALAARDTSALALTLEGQPKTIVTFTLFDKYRINGTITADNLVERVQTWMANPVFGDMVHEHRYTEYRDWGGVKFPTLIHTHQGDPRLNPGHNSQEIRVASVRVNPSGVGLTVPENIRQAGARPDAVRVASELVAPGVWRVAGESHNSVAIEFRDFVTVVEAPQDELRSLAVIGEIRRLVPNKPIRYVLNTHYHFDHSGGLRTYVAMGVTVVTHASNRDFYEQVFFRPAPRTLEPDLLSTLYPWFSQNRIAAIESVNDKYVISDGSRTLDIYATQGVDHERSMLLAFLPTERVLINADLYQPGRPRPTITRQLYENIQRLKLDVERHLPIHGEVGTHDELVRIVNQL
jgi:glyoxylase-like metal-dependent hydrolase (beta-lactamase superfamily II)